MLPPDVVREVSHDGEVPAGFEAHDLECGGHDDALLLVVGCRDTFEGAQSLEGGLSARGHVMDHPPNGACDHHGRGLVMVRTPGGIGVHVQFAELSVLDLVTGHCKKKKHTHTHTR